MEEQAGGAEDYHYPLLLCHPCIVCCLRSLEEYVRHLRKCPKEEERKGGYKSKSTSKEGRERWKQERGKKGAGDTGSKKLESKAERQEGQARNKITVHGAGRGEHRISLRTHSRKLVVLLFL